MKHHPAAREGDIYTKRRGATHWSYFLQTADGRGLGYMRAVDAKWGRNHDDTPNPFRPEPIAQQVVRAFMCSYLDEGTQSKKARCE